MTRDNLPTEQTDEAATSDDQGVNATFSTNTNTVTTFEPSAKPSKVVYQPIMDDTYTLADDTLQTRALPQSTHIQTQFADAHTTPSSSVEQTALSNAETGAPVLTKTAKSEAFTDSHILQESAQLLAPNERLADDHSLPGKNIEHMDVATKQWLLTLNWHRTSVPKPGFINKLKGHKQTLDLDLSCLLCNRYGEVIERVWFKNMRDNAESIRHQGDELLGAKPITPDNIETQLVDTDQGVTEYTDTHDHGMNQERIALYLRKIPTEIFHVVMILSSFTGNALSQADAGYCELSDDEGNVILHIDLTTIPTAPALWIATLTRVSDTWRFNADLQPLSTFHLDDIAQQVSEHILRTAK